MKNKIAIIILIIVIVFGFYFIQNKYINSFENNLAINPSEKEITENKIVTDDFEIIIPSGWQKTEPVIGVSAMAVYADEHLSDSDAQKINFKSYFAVSYDTTQGKSLNEYTVTVKNQLSQTISNILFSQEYNITINDKNAQAFEASFTQQGVNFKTLMVIVKGLDEDVWVISFNTLQSNWADYQEVFSDIANSFNLKLKK